MKILKKSLAQNVLLGSTLALLAGCATPMQSQAPTFLKHPIQIAESIERLELYARPEGMSLSARDQQAVAGFLESYARYGEGALHVNVPGQGNAGTAQTTAMIHDMMGQMGMGGQAIQQGAYQSGPIAPVVVSYRRLKTLPQDCSIRSSLSRTYNNQPYANFGCSQSANLAAMIQDPAQLIAPYDMTAPNMRRRMTVYDKYIKGENPASEQPVRQEISSVESQTQ